MSEFYGPKQAEMRVQDATSADGMAAMGKPVPLYRRQAGLEHCRAIGLTNTNTAMATVNRMSEAISRDAPYEAIEAGMAYLDLTGTYRLLAVLCTSPKPRRSVRAVVCSQKDPRAVAQGGSAACR